MSTLSKSLLRSDHSGVHEQFDCVYAAALAFKTIDEEMDKSQTLRSNQKRVIKGIVRSKMDQIGLGRDWFGITQGLCIYAFEFIELLVQNEHRRSGQTLADYFDDLLSDLARELDVEFSATQKADSIGYLKRRLGWE